MRAPVELEVVLTVEHNHVKQALPHPMPISRMEIDVTGDTSVQVWVTCEHRRIFCAPGGTRAVVDFAKPFGPTQPVVRIERVSSYGPRVRANVLFFS